jgi:hypothetical protein
MRWPASCLAARDRRGEPQRIEGLDEEIERDACAPFVRRWVLIKQCRVALRSAILRHDRPWQPDFHTSAV